MIQDTAQGGRAFVMGIEFLDQPAEKMVYTMFEISGLKPVHGPFVAIPTNITLVHISYLYISSLSSPLTTFTGTFHATREDTSFCGFIREYILYINGSK